MLMPKVYVCQICQKEFTDLVEYSKHERGGVEKCSMEVIRKISEAIFMKQQKEKGNEG